MKADIEARKLQKYPTKRCQWKYEIPLHTKIQMIVANKIKSTAYKPPIMPPKYPETYNSVGISERMKKFATNAMAISCRYQPKTH